MPNINPGVLDGVRRIGLKVRDLVVDGGLPGAPLGFRLRGATQAGPPLTGTWKAGDETRDRNGVIWICTSPGTGPGATWAQSGLLPAHNLSDVASQQAALNNLAGAVTSGDYLRGNGTNVAMSAIQAGDLPAATVSAQGAVTLDGTASDIKATGTAAAAGASGKAADASHVHLQIFGNMFGTGSDGTIVLDGVATFSFATLAGSTYTLTRDIQATSLTVNSGVTVAPAGRRIFCQGTCTVNGIISASGSAASGTNSSTGGTGVSAWTVGASETGANGGTGAGVAATPPGSYVTLAVGASGAGGAGASGAGGAGNTVKSSATSAYLTPWPILTGIVGFNNASGQPGGGRGGGSGGGDGTNSGGGGGGGGGVIAIVAWAVVNNGQISAKGGNGGTPTTGSCGGGGGGGGGLIIIYTLAAWTAGTTNVAGGTQGSGVGTGSAGVAGSSGTALNVVVS